VQAGQLHPAAATWLAEAGGTANNDPGEVLLTPGFRVVVTRHCPEGTLLCDRVTYRGEDRVSGAWLQLRGSTVYHYCPDGITPCRFLGYRFRNGSVSYEVDAEGRLRVIQAGRVLVDEQGRWQR